MTPGPRLPAGPEACEGPTTLPEGGRDSGQEAVQGTPGRAQLAFLPWWHFLSSRSPRGSRQGLG